MTYADISGCTLQSSETTPGLSNLKLRDSPLGQVPKLCPSFLLPLIEGQKMLCCTLSLLLNWTVVPTGTTRMCGWNKSAFWSITTGLAGTGNVLPAIAST